MLDDLRHRIRALERPATFAEGMAALSLGVPEVDALLGGGFARGALHEIAALSEAHLPTATGFVVGLGQAVCGATVWLAEDMGIAESGALYGPGLDGSGIAPERLLTVTVAHRRDLLWAMEEALRCRSVRCGRRDARRRARCHRGAAALACRGGDRRARASLARRSARRRLHRRDTMDREGGARFTLPCRGR